MSELANSELKTSRQQSKKYLIGILAGENSGDILGAGLISELKQIYPDAEFVGVGGSLMQSHGFKSLFDMERLSVMGFIEPLKRLPELLRMRSSIVQYFEQNTPDIFIGIDAPDFNLGIEARLKKRGIKTLHYVSPSVWAWRQGRIKKIRAAVDHMLCILPFEADFYKDHDVPVTFVGHPMANDIELDIDKASARDTIGLATKLQDKTTIAVLPGSRSKEVESLAPLFFEACRGLSKERNVEFLVAAASKKLYDKLQDLAKQSDIEINVYEGAAREVLKAADLALAASGTVTLEAMLTKTPLVVAYKLEKITFWIVSKMVKIKHVALPNILVGDEVVRELIQDDATVEAIKAELIALIDDSDRVAKIREEFKTQHLRLRRNANKEAANAVIQLIEQGA